MKTEQEIRELVTELKTLAVQSEALYAVKLETAIHYLEKVLED